MIAMKESGVPRDELWVSSKVNTKIIKSREATLSPVSSPLECG